MKKSVENRKKTTFHRSIHFLILSFAVCLFILFKGYENKWFEKKPEPKRFLQPTQKNLIKHNIPYSDYYFDVEITNLEFKDTFAIYQPEVDQYVVPKKQTIDAMKMVIHFTMKNPYQKEMAVPVPQKFSISSLQFTKSSLASFSRISQRYEIYGDVLTEDGMEVYKIEKYISGDRRATFQPNETKAFKVVFLYGDPDQISEVDFFGFNVSENQDSPAYASLNISTRMQEIRSKKSVRL